MEINKKQKVIVFVVIGVIACMLIFPPMYMQLEGGRVKTCGYQFIVDEYCRVDGITLLVQWVGILIVGALSFFMVKGRSDE